MTRVVRFFASIAVIALLLPFPATAGLPGFLTPKNGFADVVEKLLPTVVNISTTQKIEASADVEEFMRGMPQFPPGSPFEEFFKEFNRRAMPGQSRKATSLGSGFVIDASGYVVTNGHVIQDADEINVILQDNTNLKAELVGVDKKTDLAVLKVKTDKPLVAAQWGDSDKVRVGDIVLAIGNPYGLGGTVTAGIISARARDIQSGPYDDYLQTDAAINRGNSGGPMFDAEGKIIGVNTAIFSPSGGSVGIGFAIPASMAKEVVEQLKTSGRIRRGWIGVRIQVVTDDIAKSLKLDKDKGALVSDVTPGGPAVKAGIRAGDVITGFNGKEVPEMRRLPRIVAETGIDKTVPVTIWRNGKEVTLRINVGELKGDEKDGDAEDADQDYRGGDGSTNKGKLDEIGISVAALTTENRLQYGIRDEVKGVLVTRVKQDSEAQERGLSPGDVIVEIGQQEVSGIADIVRAVKNAPDGKPLLLLVNSKGDPRFIALPVKKDKSGKKPGKK